MNYLANQSGFVPCILEAKELLLFRIDYPRNSNWLEKIFIF